MIVDLLYESVSVSAVNRASVSYGLTSCGGAAETVHTNFKKVLSSGRIEVKNITDNGFFCDLHLYLPP